MHPSRQRIAELSREIADLAFMLAAAEVELAALPEIPSGDTTGADQRHSIGDPIVEELKIASSKPG